MNQKAILTSFFYKKKILWYIIDDVKFCILLEFMGFPEYTWLGIMMVGVTQLPYRKVIGSGALIMLTTALLWGKGEEGREEKQKGATRDIFEISECWLKTR